MDRIGKVERFSTRQLRETHANLNSFYYLLAQTATVVYDVSHGKGKKLA